MREQTGVAGYRAMTSQMRSLAVRIGGDLRAQLDLIAQLNDRGVTAEIRIAPEQWIQTSKSDPKVLQRAETVRAEIEREAETKRNAISAIFEGSATANKHSKAHRVDVLRLTREPSGSRPLA